MMTKKKTNMMTNMMLEENMTMTRRNLKRRRRRDILKKMRKTKVAKPPKTNTVLKRRSVDTVMNHGMLVFTRKLGSNLIAVVYEDPVIAVHFERASELQNFQLIMLENSTAPPFVTVQR
jgi:hypothetical protein